ncbi:MAG: ribonuclease P protein component [Candidatus Moraniibacteriota bacterium]|jgi:ribonuclease P protein component
MLGRTKRLRHNKDFIRVFKHGKRHFHSGVLLSFRVNHEKCSRIGFIVGKKHSLLAVNRNRQRRILQSVMTELYPQIKPGFDIIISYTNRDKVLTYKEAYEILVTMLHDISLLSN